MNDMVKEKGTDIGQRVCIAYPASPDDEISLADIWNIFWENKKIIVGSFFACLALSILLAFFLPKIYRTEAVLLPPGVSEIAGLFVTDIYEPDPEAVYAEFLKNLRSIGLRYTFFEEEHIIKSFMKNTGKGLGEYAIFKEKIDKWIHISSSGKGKQKNGGIISVSLDGGNADDISHWLDNYITFVDKYTINNLVGGIQSQIKIRIGAIKEKIATLHLTALQERKDRIVALKEAMVIAKHLNIEKPTGSAFVVKDQEDNTRNQPTGVVLNSQDVPLYFRGYKALQGELEQLQQRKNDDPFVIGLRKLQGELAFLEKKHIDSKLIHTVRLDQKASFDDRPVKPKRMLFVVLGGIVGVMIGIFSAFVRNMIFLSRKKSVLTCR